MVFDNLSLTTSSNAVGCTAVPASVRGSPNNYSDVNLRMIDTIGLSESLEGTVPSHEAMNILENKLDSLYSKDGIHLILFCIRKGRQSEATSQHYRTIVHDLCESKVPRVLVITRCEDDEPLGEWWKDNETHIRGRLGFDVNDAVAVTAIKTGETLADYHESRKRLIEAIEKHALAEPWRAKDFRQKFSSFFRTHISHKSNVQPKNHDPFMKHLQRPMDARESSKAKRFWPWS